ncbi:MAG: anion permease [Ruminococcus sp.]|uniref:SLC13 family permease n=1 Tax=Ruminococcus sp. TaxID=41978 RepID=UPI0025DD618E|nr:SLC13 family permease [Ruminococcus sp.]MCR5600949.1 anion permease [Ruminococcus sp.]
MVELIFGICIVLFVVDIFPAASVSLACCTAFAALDICSVTEAFAGFSNDIVLVVFGTEIFGIAYQESGLSRLTARKITALSKGKEKNIIIAAGVIAAALSAFLNNQVVCSLMLVICITLAKELKNINVLNITLPVIYLAILGGQCTLIGAPATLVASSMAEGATGKGISMFELLPMGAIILCAGLLYICVFSHRKGEKMWKTRGGFDLIVSEETLEVDRKKCAVTLCAGAAMLIGFVTGVVSVGIASLVGALICLFGKAVKQKESFAKIDWNILIWLGCSIGMANALNKSGRIQDLCEYISAVLPENTSPVLLLAAIVFVTMAISNLISNTTTVMMIMPFAIDLAQRCGYSARPFIIGVTLASGLAVLTPLSCGFIGMTTRVGYKFSDYVRYGAGFQLFLYVLTVLSTCLFYSF